MPYRDHVALSRCVVHAYARVCDVLYCVVPFACAKQCLLRGRDFTDDSCRRKPQGGVSVFLKKNRNTYSTSTLTENCHTARARGHKTSAT